jgi:hypothetical protein
VPLALIVPGIIQVVYLVAPGGIEPPSPEPSHLVAPQKTVTELLLVKLYSLQSGANVVVVVVVLVVVVLVVVVVVVLVLVVVVVVVVGVFASAELNVSLIIGPNNCKLQVPSFRE